MKKIIRIANSNTNLLAIDTIDGIDSASISLDSGETWTEVDYQSSIVQDNLYKFDNSLEKENFFNTHIGHKIKIDNINFSANDIKSGWLIIKSLDNITIRIDGSDKFISVSYEEIGFDMIDETRVKFTFDLIKIETIEDTSEEEYNRQLEYEINNNKTITPKNI